MSRLIYIVDDQPCVLAALGYLVRTFDPNWEVREFYTPTAAIEAVRKSPPHLVMTDQTMPLMMGSQLLDVVRQIAPATIRIIISGHAAQTDKIGAAHQYLSKPFDLREIERRIRQALNAQETLANPELARLVTSLQSFPALPGTYTELLRELEDDESNSVRAAGLLNRDGGMLTRILQLANSPLFRGDHAVTNSFDALMVLGVSTVEALVLSLHVFRSYDQLHFPEFSLELLWRHSWETARLAGEMCRKKGLGDAAAHEALFAGLVHDLGRLILMENRTAEYRATCQRAVQEQKPLVEVEKQIFHVTHGELSGFMLRLWGLNPAVIDAAIYCDAPWESPNNKQFNPTVALYVANILTRQSNPPDPFITPELNREYLTAMGALELAKWRHSRIGS